jgi:hypothetical protein
MRATHHFHRGLLITKTHKKKRKFKETHWKYFWSFWFLKKKSKLKRQEKTKTRKLVTRESSQQAKKRRTRKSFWVFSYTTDLNLKGKTEKKQEIFFDLLKVFQTHKKKARK